MASEGVTEYEIEAVYEALKAHIAKLNRLKEELDEPNEDLLLWILTLSRLSMRLQRLIDYMKKGEMLVAEAEACALSKQVKYIMVTKTSDDPFYLSSRSILATIVGFSDPLCKALG